MNQRTTHESTTPAKKTSSVLVEAPASPSKAKHSKKPSLSSLLVITLLCSVAFAAWNLKHLSHRVVEFQDLGEQLGESFTHPATSKKPTTLALLYPPGLLGGYRNQVIRLIGFCAYARKHNLKQLLLPSLLWSTQLGGIGLSIDFSPIPMEWVFDIKHWNTYRKHLPVLVEGIQHSDCWMPGIEIKNNSLSARQQAVLQQGTLRPISNVTIAKITGESRVDPRKIDFYPQVEHCQHPVVYGGGRQAGRLWDDVMAYRKNKATNGSIPFEQDHWVLQALRPAPKWRAVADQCVRKHATNGQYIALHARVELEMFEHRCGEDMEWNFTKILHQVQGLSDGLSTPITGVFVAVSRAGMEEKGRLYKRFKKYADENLRTLNYFVGKNGAEGHRLGGKKLSVFECGEKMLDDYYKAHPGVPDHGSLLQSVMNFYIAVHADVFMGVSGSSYSTDVLTTRYHLGKGARNYRYTPDGIEQVENGGLPEPHVNCNRKKKKK